MSAETDLLPLPPLYIVPSVEPVDYPDVAQALIDYARANVAHATAEKDAEIERLQAEVEEWKDAARCASEQQDSLFREARAFNERTDKLRAEVERLNRILGRIVEGDGDSTVAIRAGTDAFAAAREYLLRDQEEGK